MLSLSIFSSSQRISVALYKENNLKKFLEKNITGKKIDSIFLLLNKVLNSKERINNIFFSVGPGSFTALRSIKAIAQGFSLFYQANIINVTDFEIYLAQISNNKDNVLVFYETFNKKFFYQLFKPHENVYKSESTLLNGDIDSLKSFINKEKRKNKNFVLISDSNKFFSSFNSLKNLQKIISRPCAKKIAKAVFLGYGKRNQDIIYHNTYYE